MSSLKSPSNRKKKYILVTVSVTAIFLIVPAIIIPTFVNSANKRKTMDTIEMTSVSSSKESTALPTMTKTSKVTAASSVQKTDAKDASSTQPVTTTLEVIIANSTKTQTTTTKMLNASSLTATVLTTNSKATIPVSLSSTPKGIVYVPTERFSCNRHR